MEDLSQDLLQPDGAPFLLLHKNLLGAWHGVFGPGGGETDYDRACQVDDYVGTILVGGETVLVLAEQPAPIGLYPANDDFKFLFRTRYADRLSAACLETVPDTAWRDTGIRIFLDGDYLLFPATCNEEALEESLPMHFCGATYSIQEQMFCPDEETSLVLTRFVRL